MPEHDRPLHYLLPVRAERGEGFGLELRLDDDHAYLLLAIHPSEADQLERMVNDAEKLRRRYDSEKAAFTVETEVFEGRFGALPREESEEASADLEERETIAFWQTLEATEMDGMGRWIAARVVRALEAAGLLGEPHSCPVRVERKEYGTFFTFDDHLEVGGPRYGALSVGDLREMRLVWAESREELRRRFRELADHHPRAAIRFLGEDGPRPVAAELEPEDLKALLGHDQEEVRQAAFYAAGQISGALVEPAGEPDAGERQGGRSR